MAFSMLAVFFITLLISFVGSLPFGPINLVMIDTTLKNSLRAGFWFSFAAALVEMGQSLVALHGSSWLSREVYDSPWIKIVGFILFSLLGLLFLFKKNHDSTTVNNTSQKGFFVKGLVVASLNPQAIPFWVIILAYLQSAQISTVNSHSTTANIISFAVGASCGKLGALMLFGIMSQQIISRSSLIRNHINRIIGIILLAVGMFQGILAFVV